jgi:hypothetical protein
LFFWGQAFIKALFEKLYFYIKANTLGRNISLLVSLHMLAMTLYPSLRGNPPATGVINSSLRGNPPATGVIDSSMRGNPPAAAAICLYFFWETSPKILRFAQDDKGHPSQMVDIVPFSQRFAGS